MFFQQFHKDLPIPDWCVQQDSELAWCLWDWEASTNPPFGATHRFFIVAHQGAWNCLVNDVFPIHHMGFKVKNCPCPSLGEVEPEIKLLPPPPDGQLSRGFPWNARFLQLSCQRCYEVIGWHWLLIQFPVSTSSCTQGHSDGSGGGESHGSS